MKAFVLTAGKGERLRPVTEEWPKPSIPLLNIPLMYYSVTPIIKLGCKELIFNLHHNGDGIRKTAEPFKALLPIHFSDETDKLLGSGGAIWAAKNKLEREEYFVVANGDTVFLPKNSNFLKNAIKEHQNSKALATLLVMNHEEAGKKFGAIWCDDVGRVGSFGKSETRPILKPKHFIGFQILSPRIFDYLPIGESHIFSQVLHEAIIKNEVVRVSEVEGLWYETGNEEDFLKATKSLVDVVLSGNSKFMNDLGDLYWPNDPETQKLSTSSKFSRRVLAGSHVEVEENVDLKGFCVIGDGVKIEKNSKLKNVVVLPGAVIPEGFEANDTVLFSQMP